MNFISREQQTITSQRVRIEELEETIRQMRESLAPAINFPIAWRLSPTEQRILAAFARAPNGYLSNEQIFVVLESKSEDMPNLARVFISSIRKKTERVCIRIFTRWGAGYETPLDSLSVIRSALGHARVPT